MRRYSSSFLGSEILGSYDLYPKHLVTPPLL